MAFFVVTAMRTSSYIINTLLRFIINITNLLQLAETYHEKVHDTHTLDRNRSRLIIVGYRAVGIL
jgi:hypothetical protein